MRCRGAINSAGLSSIISPSCSVHPRRNSVGKEEVSLPPSLPLLGKGGIEGEKFGGGGEERKVNRSCNTNAAAPLSPPAHTG